MSRVISVHEYVLAVDVTDGAFERAVSNARERDLFDLPGLVEYAFLKGLRGDRRGSYTAVWTYESREAWERLWGPPGEPVEKDEYPESWKVWEDELLAPLLDRDPDEITHTAYEEFRPKPND